LLAGTALGWIGREEDVADRVAPAARHIKAEPESLALKEAMGKLEQDAGPIAGLWIPSSGAAVTESTQELETLLNDVTRFVAADMRDKPDAASVVLGPRVVESPTS
jgi:hypothetical protein